MNWPHRGQCLWTAEQSTQAHMCPQGSNRTAVSPPPQILHRLSSHSRWFSNFTQSVMKINLIYWLENRLITKMIIMIVRRSINSLFAGLSPNTNDLNTVYWTQQGQVHSEKNPQFSSCYTHLADWWKEKGVVLIWFSQRLNLRKSKVCWYCSFKVFKISICITISWNYGR